MTNLLPPIAKKEIVIEYWVRVICAWVILWSVSLFVGIVLLWPTYVLLTGNNEAYSESVSAATERTNEYEELSKILTRSSTQAEEVISISSRPLLSGITQEIWNIVDINKIEITNLQLDRKDAVVDYFLVGGEAVDRQALAQFRDALEAIPFIRSVDLPIENLAKNEDISFALTVEIINEKL